MTPDRTSANDTEDLLRLAEDEIVRLRAHGDPDEKREAARRRSRGGFVALAPRGEVQKAR